MNTPKWNGVLRHLLTFISTALIAYGVGNEEVINQIGDIIFDVVGSILLIVSLWKSTSAAEKQITNATFQQLKRNAA